jgi:hypothetical protein
MRGIWQKMKTEDNFFRLLLNCVYGYEKEKLENMSDADCEIELTSIRDY